MKNLLCTIGTISAIILGNSVQAMPPKPGSIKVYMTVKFWDGKGIYSEKVLSNSRISVIDRNGQVLLESYSDEEGECSFKASLENSFSIHIAKVNYVTKSMYIEVRDTIDTKKKYAVECEVVLYRETNDIDLSVLSKPIVKLRYNKYTSAFDYDSLPAYNINQSIKKRYMDHYKWLADSLLQQRKKNKLLDGQNNGNKTPGNRAANRLGTHNKEGKKIRIIRMVKI
ncbi:MAG TPA: hypothetical protein VK177_09795 [Flavobacteriales bacterium]|nr:hypothetical protein [Flavobacteriales bacterium]